jgi:hypothetical protein
MKMYRRRAVVSCGQKDDRAHERRCTQRPPEPAGFVEFSAARGCSAVPHLMGCQRGSRGCAGGGRRSRGHRYTGVGGSHTRGEEKDGQKCDKRQTSLAIQRHQPPLSQVRFLDGPHGHDAAQRLARVLRASLEGCESAEAVVMSTAEVALVVSVTAIIQ